MGMPGFIVLRQPAGNWADDIMRVRRCFCLILGVSVLGVCQAGAQTLPWPADGAEQAAPIPFMMAPALSPPQTPPHASLPPCMAEFAKLREEVQKLGETAKAAGQQKVSREEMCTNITAYAVAELKWVKFAEAGVGSCGIPPEVAKQLKQVHANTEQTKEKVCQQSPHYRFDAPMVPQQPQENIRGWRE
jgi:hypothetical protein